MRSGTLIAALLLASCSYTGSVCTLDMRAIDAGAGDAAMAPRCGLVGTWTSSHNTITFAANNTYTATLSGMSDSGTWALSGPLECGATVTFSDASCGTIQGEYGLSIDPTCTTFSLSGQSDDCGMRANELSDTQYKKQ